jgi:hypothetical protein
MIMRAAVAEGIPGGFADLAVGLGKVVDIAEGDG